MIETTKAIKALKTILNQTNPIKRVRSKEYSTKVILFYFCTSVKLRTKKKWKKNEDKPKCRGN